MTSIINRIPIYHLIIAIAVIVSCTHSNNRSGSQARTVTKNDSVKTCCLKAPKRFSVQHSDDSIRCSVKLTHKDMVFIVGGTFEMGGDNKQASPDEYPKHL